MNKKKNRKWISFMPESQTMIFTSLYVKLKDIIAFIYGQSIHFRGRFDPDNSDDLRVTVKTGGGRRLCGAHNEGSKYEGEED